MKRSINELKKSFFNKYKNFKKEIQQEKSKSRSKKRDFMIGFGTILSVFGITLLGPKLTAIAKETSKNPGSTPNTPNPSPTTTAPNPATAERLSGAAATVCAAAVTSGNFLVGAICGLIVVGGILYVQGGKK